MGIYSWGKKRNTIFFWPFLRTSKVLATRVSMCIKIVFCIGSFIIYVSPGTII